MAEKETLKDKCARLEKECESWKNDYFSVKRQVNATVEETDAYKIMRKNFHEACQRADHYKEMADRYQKQLKAREDQLSECMKKLENLEAQTKHNARNAGRKPKITEEQTEIIITMNAQGVSSRKIAKEVGLSPSTVLRIIRAAENN